MKLKIIWIIITSVIISLIIAAAIIWACYNTIITADTAWKLGGTVIGIVQIITLCISLYISGTSQQFFEKIKHKPDKPESSESQKVSEPLKQHDAREETKNPVALAVSAIIFHKTSNPPKILFCWSDKQERYILPGGHFYKRVGDANEKIPVWSVNPDTRPDDFLLEEKLKDKYGIIAHLDEDFHHERKDIRGMATIEPTPFLNLFEKPSHDDGHVWHFDFYYMCKIESPEDSKIDDDRRFEWWFLKDVQQMVKKKKTFANLQEVIEVAIDKKAKKPITDKRGEEV